MLVLFSFQMRHGEEFTLYTTFGFFCVTNGLQPDLVEHPCLSKNESFNVEPFIDSMSSDIVEIHWKSSLVDFCRHQLVILQNTGNAHFSRRLIFSNLRQMFS